MSFERTFCAAEIEQLKELLQEIPDENVIERIGLEQRPKARRNIVEVWVRPVWLPNDPRIC